MSTMSQVPPPRFDAEPPKRGWFGRNWLWFVPTVIVLPILLCAGCFGGLFFIGVAALKGNPAYQQALKRVQDNPEVQAQLGQPIDDATVLPQGQFNLENGEGTAKFFFSVKGPKGSANVIAEAETTDGNWHYDKLELTCDADGTKIDLSEAHVPNADDAPAFAPDADEAAAAEGTDDDSPAPALEINVE